MVNSGELLYQKESPPLGKDKQIQVKANLTLLDIGIVDEIQQSFAVKIAILLQL